MSIVLKKQKMRFNDVHFDGVQNTSLTPDQKNLLNSKKLKIAIVTETWSPEINGVANSLLNLCKGLQISGHEILLIRPQPQKTCDFFQPEDELWVKAQAIPKYPTLQFGWPQISKIGEAFDRFKPDVVHIVTEGPLGLAALFVAKSKKIPISSGFHSAFHEFSRYFEFPFLVRPMTSYLCWFHNRTAITCIPSDDTAQSLRSMGVRATLQVVGRGVNTTLFNSKRRSEVLRQAWGASANTKVLLSVGRLSPEKEVKIIINAFKNIQKQGQYDLKLVVVGDGPDRQNLETLAGGTDVIFTGSLMGEVLATAYASADVFVFPSRVETFGNVVLEALASGLPVIAYDYACAKLHIRSAETGWLIPLGQIEGMTQAIENILAVKNLREMGLRAEKDVAEAGWTQPVLDFEHALHFARWHSFSELCGLNVFKT